MEQFDQIFSTVIANYKLTKNKSTGEWEHITAHVPQYKQAKKRQCEGDSEVWNYWRLLHQSHVLRMQSGNEAELRELIKQYERDDVFAEEEIERLRVENCSLTKENRDLRSVDHQQSIQALREEIVQLKEDLLYYTNIHVYGIKK